MSEIVDFSFDFIILLFYTEEKFIDLPIPPFQND